MSDDEDSDGLYEESLFPPAGRSDAVSNVGEPERAGVARAREVEERWEDRDQSGASGSESYSSGSEGQSGEESDERDESEDEGDDDDERLGLGARRMSEGGGAHRRVDRARSGMTHSALDM